MLWSILVPFAHAFCGTFVGGEGATVHNEASAVILARDGSTTTLTVAMDYTGNARDFALLLPVPSVLTAEDVTTVDPALLTKVQTYASPRMVDYTCDNVVSSESSAPICGFSMGCADQKPADSGYSLPLVGLPSDDTVQVESSFSVASYDIVVLSAEESAGLMDWLSANGYSVPTGGEEILQEYIDAGVYFLAAKIRLDAIPTGKTWLPPLQFSYESEALTLPIRIGTISATDRQEVEIFVINDSTLGNASIANYPEVKIETECMPKGADSLTDAYSGYLDAALSSEAGWVTEHSWDMSQACDPCTVSAPFSVDEMATLGFGSADSGHYGYNLGHITALRMRYSPDQAREDLILYHTRYNENMQSRYVHYREEMEQFFPICGDGWAPDPGTCFEEPACSVPGDLRAPLASMATIMGMLIWRRRRA